MPLWSLEKGLGFCLVCVFIPQRPAGCPVLGEKNPFEFVKSNIESAQQLGSYGICRTAEHHGLCWQEADVSKIIN